MEAAPASDCGCGGEVAMEAPAEMGYVSDSMESYDSAGTYEAPAASDEGFNLAPGEVMVPGSLQTIGTTGAVSDQSVLVGEEAIPAPQADPAMDSPKSSSDNASEMIEEAAPPTPAADPTTDA